MNRLLGKLSGRVVAGTCLVLCATTTNAAAQGAVTLVSQERVIQARVFATTQTRTSVDAGPFVEALSLSEQPNPRLPGASANARQASLIALRDGALEVRGQGSEAGTIGGSGTAFSRITTTFTADGTVPWVLQWDGRLGHAALTGPGGTVYEHTDSTGGKVFESGSLPAGQYTFLIEVSSLFGEFNVRFTAGKPAPADGPRCTARVTTPRYHPGDVVTAAPVLLENPLASAAAVELKMYVRAPDGSVHAAANAGADGSLWLPAGYSHLHNSALWTVDADDPTGLWEFGCRLLNPASGAELFESSDLFEIQPAP